jgi:hypothetical protein
VRCLAALLAGFAGGHLAAVFTFCHIAPPFKGASI